MTVPTPEQVNENLGELATRMDIRITEVGEQTITAEMPVAGNRQPYGLLHGGASAVLAETIGSILSYLVGPPEHYPVGIELSVSHHASARDGVVQAKAHTIKAGRTLATIAIDIRQGELQIATARLSCLYRPVSE